jgi:hypothetical protein
MRYWECHCLHDAVRFLSKRRQRGGCHNASFYNLYPGFSLTLYPGLYCVAPLALVFDSPKIFRADECYIVYAVGLYELIAKNVEMKTSFKK